MSENIFIPSLLVTQVYFPYCEEKGATAEILKKVAGDGFYEAIEIDCHYAAEERQEIGNIVKEQDWVVTQWLTSKIDKEKLDLSSINETLRDKSAQAIISMLDKAAEIGVHNIAFISGPSPGEELREAALESFYLSLCEICAAAKSYGINVLIEPLDYRAHKQKALGTTDETVRLISKVREEYNNLYFAFDTAHAALNEEDLREAVIKALPLMDQIHFSNAILDSREELYGDHHLPIDDETGFLNQAFINELLLHISSRKAALNGKLRVAIEVQGKSNQKLHENESIARELLGNGFQFVEKRRVKSEQHS